MNNQGQGVKLSFGQWLKARRKERCLTLRDVERITSGAISNAYLSQLENDQIESPGVAKLHVLSAAYGMDFALLCEKASVGERPAAPAFCPHCGQLMREQPQ
jgi:transcriptional regulator with XRE-family HTH domain